MKLLFSANLPAEEAALQLVKATLEAEGVACLVRNEQLAIAKGDIPITECVPELWVLEDKDYAKALVLWNEWKASRTQPRAAWVCPSCQENNEGQFAACWKCGTAIPAE